MGLSIETPPKSAGSCEKIAVLINTDTDPETSRKHAQNISRAIDALKAEDGSYKIYVVSPEKPQQLVESWLPVSAQNLDALLKGVAEKADKNDMVVFYVTGHAGIDPHGETALPMGDDAPYSVEHFYEGMNHILYGKRFVAMDACLSGNAISRFANDHTVVLSAGSPGEAVACHAVAPFFWEPEIAKVDKNHDGLATLQERFANMMDGLAGTGVTQHPIFYGAALLPMDLTGEEGPQGVFPTEVIVVYTREEFDRELAGLKPGELSLVDFSATWCGPCKDYKPQFEDLAKAYQGRFKMIRVESKGDDEAALLMHELGIEGLPTVAFMDAARRLTLLDASARSDPIARIHQTVLTSDGQLEELLRKLPGALFVDQLIVGQLFRKSSPIFQKIGRLGEDGVKALPEMRKILISEGVEDSPISLQVTLEAMGPKALPELVRWLDVDKDGAVPDTAYFVFTKAEGEERQQLVESYLWQGLKEAVREGDVNWRNRILFTLGDVGWPLSVENLPLVLPFLRHEHPEIVVNALRVIYRMREIPPEALAEIERLIQSSGNDDVLIGALTAAFHSEEWGSGFSFSKETITRVGRLLASPDRQISLPAANFLLVNNETHPDLKRTLWEAAYAGDGLAARLLARFDLERQEREQLNSLLKSESGTARDMALQIIAHQGHKKFPGVFDVFVERFDEVGSFDRARYIELLGYYGDPQALPLICSFAVMNSYRDDVFAAFGAVVEMDVEIIPDLTQAIQTVPMVEHKLFYAACLAMIALKNDLSSQAICDTIRGVLAQGEGGQWVFNQYYRGLKIMLADIEGRQP